MIPPSKRKEYARLYMRKYRKRTKGAADRKRDKRRCIDAKNAVLQLYGHSCACCATDEPLFLVIDHINDDGKQERLLYGSGERFYRWLVKQAYQPDRYQVLCWNCNHAKRFGVCPHRI